MLAALKARLSDLYQKLNKLLRGAPECIVAALANFNRMRAGQAAASLAYYALFSLFPLLLLFIALGSSVLERNQVEELVIQYVGQVLPVSTEVLETNIDTALELRGPLGATGLIGLLWSAIGVFTALAINVNLAWADAREHNIFMRRLIGLLMIIVMVVLLLVSLIINGLVQLLIRYRGAWNITVSVYEANLWSLLSLGISLALVFLMFLVLYKFVPTCHVSWRASFWGALTASLLAFLATRLFTWYQNVGLGNYEAVYGSLGTIVALMFLIYLLGVVTLYGAHLAASIDSGQDVALVPVVTHTHEKPGSAAVVESPGTK